MRFCLALLGVLALVLPAIAQEHGATHGLNHSWYNGLKRQDGFSCCNNQDCDKARDWNVKGDHYEVLLNGVWCPVPNHTVLQNISTPDGEAHVCASLHAPPGQCPTIYCFMPGSGS